jgi:hypothetical protein
VKYGSNVWIRAELAKMRELSPPTQEQRRVLDVAMAIRKARGMFKDKYSPEELDAVDAARKLAGRIGQLKVYFFLRVYNRAVKTTIEIPMHVAAHACPLCGEYHIDTGTRTGASKAKMKENRLALLRFCKSVRERRARNERRRKARLRKAMRYVNEKKGEPT